VIKLRPDLRREAPICGHMDVIDHTARWEASVVTAASGQRRLLMPMCAMSELPRPQADRALKRRASIKHEPASEAASVGAVVASFGANLVPQAGPGGMA
jgi:hypothetical protein